MTPEAEDDAVTRAFHEVDLAAHLPAEVRQLAGYAAPI